MIDLWATKTLMYDPVDFSGMLQETGTINDKPETLKPECYNETPVDAEKAWTELERSCRGS